MKKTIVSITACSEYVQSTVRQAVEETLRAVPDVDTLLSPGKTVLLKPNLLSASQPPQNAVNTHPAFVKAVSCYCRDRGCSVLIGDSCGTLSPGSTGKALEITGIVRVAEETGARVVNFDAEPFENVTVPEGRVLSSVNISKAVRDADVVITLPKLKTHGLTLLTGAVKNMYGAVPGRHKKNIHLLAPKPAQFSQAVVDVFSVTAPHLAVMDGITAMEGNGPAGGQPRRLGLILASSDAVALDAVAGDIIGYSPEQVLTTAYAAERGLGCGDLKDIDITGAMLEDVCVPNFRRPSACGRKWLWRILPGFVARSVVNCFGTAYPYVLGEKCVMCRECVVNCPAGALNVESGRIKLLPEKCIGCYCCSEACPHGAIEFRSRRIPKSFVSRNTPHIS